jgi:eukaryotic-like serine/threonine-protein kinase
MACPEPDRVLDYLAGQLSSAERDAIDAHVDTCAACRALFVELARTGLDEVATAPIEEPTAIGRYRVEARLGDGGMGTVYAAYDPQLDRRVAVKLVHPELAKRGGIERLLREGRALARLAHPNVVTVHDAGTDGDRVYVAMELVEGETLATWLKAAPRSWQDIVGKLVAAGRGIAAAHKAGIVHRDVKPENVLLDRDGTPKVADFGLAGHSDPVPVDLSPGDLTEPMQRLTQPGTVMGTPLFMSPEQRRGEEVGPATDQYSLCAALDHALGRTKIPTWLRSAIDRGLAADPADRFDSIDDLIAALDPARRAARRRTFAIAAAAGAALLAVGAGAFVVTRDQRDPFGAACATAAAERSALWSASDKAAIAAAMQATKVPYAAETPPRVDTAVTSFLADLAGAEATVCKDRPTTRDGRATFEQAIACLAERRDELRTLVGELHHATALDVQRAVNRVHELPMPEECANPTTLAAERDARSTPERAAKRDQLATEVRAAFAAQTAGKLRESVDAAKRAVALARTFGGVLLAKTLLILGTFEYIDGFPACEAAQREAAAVAEGVHADELRAQAMANLMAATAREPGREKEALAMQPLVEAAIARANKQVGLTPVVHQAVGTAQLRLGQYDAAIASFKAALDAARKLLPRGDPRLPDYIDPVGVALSHARRFAEALPYNVEAHQAAVDAFGAHHPNAAIYAINMATKHGALGDCTKALAELAEARAALTGVLRPESPEHLQIMEVMGTCYFMQHRYDDALREHTARQAALRASGNERSTDMAATWIDIGDVQLDQKQLDAAVASYRRSVDELENVVGKTDTRLGWPLSKVGEAELAAGRPDRAMAPLERALALYIAAQVPPIVMAEVQFPLARALPAKDAVRAKQLATAAAAAFATGGVTYTDRATAAEAWLRSRR